VRDCGEGGFSPKKRPASPGREDTILFGKKKGNAGALFRATRGGS